ncbi:hypothetical protein ACI79C_22560 [Geodermatophilus sp. SYSU D00697]
MEHLVQAVRAAVAQRNLYAALALALTLPDICGSIEPGDDGSRRRYTGWWDKHVGALYRHPVGAEAQEHVFMTGGDCYALRCALLHQGLDDVTAHRAREVVERFHFVQPTAGGWVVHRNQVDSVLMLQVDQFCEELCQAVERWLEEVRGDPRKAAELNRLMFIDDFSSH